MKTLGSNLFVLPFVLASLLLTGCTAQLWNCQTRSFCEPAANPDLALYESKSKSDVLVEYTAISDLRDQAVRLAYFSEANKKRIAAGEKPRLVNPKQARKMQPIPIMGLSAKINPPAAPNGIVEVAGDQRSFTLYRPGHKPENGALPFYQDGYGTAEKVALTPVTVLADASMASAVAAVFAWYVCAQSGVQIAVPK